MNEECTNIRFHKKFGCNMGIEISKVDGHIYIL